MHEELPKMVEGSSAQGRAEEPSQTHEGTGAGNGAQTVGKCKHCGQPAAVRKNGKFKEVCSVQCVKRAWKARNPEHRRQDYLQNKERYLERAKEWRQANPLRKQARNREWRANNLERALAAEQAHRDKVRDKVRAAGRKRWALLAAAPKEERDKITAWRAQWKSLLVVNCHWCKKDFPPNECQTDHILALGRGGPHTLSNVCISCIPCNRSKSMQPVDQWKQRINVNV